MKVSVSTYDWWPLTDDRIWEQMKYDLEDIEVDWKIQVSGYWDYNPDDVDVEPNLDFDKFKLDLAEYLQGQLEQEVQSIMGRSLKDIFADWDIEYEGMHFYTPQYYNFENDALDMRLKCKLDDDEWKKKHIGKLTELVNRYIDEVRMESYDWYMSFEPTSIDDSDWDDYNVIRAILKTEGKSGYGSRLSLYDILKDCLQDCVDEWVDEIYYQNMDLTYKIRVPNDKDWDWVECKLDYDKKILFPTWK